MSHNRLLRLSEAATRLSVSERTLRRLIAENRLRAIRVRGSIRISEAEVDRVLLGTAGDPHDDGTTQRVAPPVRAEVRRLSKAWNAARDTLLAALEDYGALGAIPEAPVRALLADLWHLDARVDEQLRPVMDQMPQTLAEVDDFLNVADVG